MPAPKLEDYARGLRILMNAKNYLENRHRLSKTVSLIPFADEQLILGHAIIDVVDAIAALMRGERDARPKS